MAKIIVLSNSKDRKYYHPDLFWPKCYGYYTSHVDQIIENSPCYDVIVETRIHAKNNQEAMKIGQCVKRRKTALHVMVELDEVHLK
jgi:hypothetical protein